MKAGLAGSPLLPDRLPLPPGPCPRGLTTCLPKILAAPSKDLGPTPAPKLGPRAFAPAAPQPRATCLPLTSLALGWALGPLPPRSLRPLLAPLTQLQQPALAVGVEERVGQVVAVVLRDLEGLVLDALVQVLPGQQRRPIQRRPVLPSRPAPGTGQRPAQGTGGEGRAGDASRSVGWCCPRSRGPS